MKTALYGTKFGFPTRLICNKFKISVSSTNPRALYTSSIQVNLNCALLLLSHQLVDNKHPYPKWPSVFAIFKEIRIRQL